MNGSREINFQLYVESVKQRKISWNVFANLMKDFSHSDICKLKDLNAILFAELTPNHSNSDKFRYLNSIFLSEFKTIIQKQDGDFENESLECCSKSMVGSQLYYNLIKV